MAAISSNQKQHFLWLIGIVALGAALRLTFLAAKPLWLDEVITALFSVGRSTADVPLNTLFPISDLKILFSVKPGVPLADIVNHVNTDSLHPPLFFMLMYGWVSWLTPDEYWVWVLRCLPALFGLGAIAAVYWLTRLAYTPRAGLVAAALMAVSPFVVYLSQEARHYTMPMLWITLALAALVQMQTDLYSGKGLRPWVWFGWIGLNLLALYTHYFALLTLAAQLGAIALWLAWQDGQHRTILWWRWGAIALAVGGIGVGYAPWLRIMTQHLSRPETNWLTRDPNWAERVQYLVQLVVNGVLMVVAFPVERQPLPVIVLSALLVVGVAGFLVWQIVQGANQLRPSLSHYPGIWLLLGFGFWILMEFLVIIYGLNRNITAAPRYNFVVYPAVCALLAIALCAASHQNRGRGILAILLTGLLSSGFVNANLVFQKAYYPDEVAQAMVGDGDRPVIMLSSYQSLQEIALGLSFALEMPNQYEQATGKPSTLDAIPIELGFMFRPTGGYRPVWEQLAKSQTQLKTPLNLWAIATPGMKQDDYPEKLQLQTTDQPPQRIRCLRQPDGYRETGVPYQQFACR